MYLEHKAREKRNKREDVLLGGIILGRSTRTKKSVEKP
jgi:hypothetical protein